MRRAARCTTGATRSAGWMDQEFEAEAKTKGKLIPDGRPDCPICYASPGKYGVSVECHHLFCTDWCVLYLV